MDGSKWYRYKLKCWLLIILEQKELNVLKF
jgi:hypothetical protein